MFDKTDGVRVSRQPTLKQLKYLCAVAEHQHFGQAAKACHVSQSTLSASIVELEDALSASLVERNNRSVLLTALAAAAATCLVGQMAFVGLLAPHLARALVGPRHGLVLPLAGLVGATLLLTADTLGRAALPGTPLSAAAVMALLGAPLFVWIARRHHG